MPESPRRRVFSVSPMPPEKSAYALARYSRSADSIQDSLAWVRAHDSTRFLESFYFQYGHASIADLGHLVLCFEGISELAATEVEDEQLWDGQARSSRYQDFSKSGFIVPGEFDAAQTAVYRRHAGALLEAYSTAHARMVEYYREKLPRPDDMKPEAYQRNIAARAFDAARYLLFFGIPTNIGQVTSIRTLERQVRRLRASEFEELRQLAAEIAAACAAPPVCVWSGESAGEPLAPTLARHLAADEHARQSRLDLARAAEALLPAPAGAAIDDVDLLCPSNPAADCVATLLYPVTNRPFRELYEIALGWSEARRREVFDAALRSRSSRDELLRNFRGSVYAFDLIIDIGAYRDLHRHRRCQQFRQRYTGQLGCPVPQPAIEAGIGDLFSGAFETALAAMRTLPEPGAQYLLPFGARSRFLFKMDFAEAEYIIRLRSGVKGHFSYRETAWKMKEKLAALEPELAPVLSATPPWVEDPLER